MSTDHRRPNEVENPTSPRINDIAEFILIMVITGAVALGGVAFLTV